MGSKAKAPVRRLADWGSHEKNGKIAFGQ